MPKWQDFFHIFVAMPETLRHNKTIFRRQKIEESRHYKKAEMPCKRKNVSGVRNTWYSAAKSVPCQLAYWINTNFLQNNMGRRTADLSNGKLDTFKKCRKKRKRNRIFQSRRPTKNKFFLKVGKERQESAFYNKH